MDTQPSNEETTVAPPVVVAPVAEPVEVVAPVELVAPRNVRAEIAEELLTRVLATPLCEDGNIMAFIRAAVARVQREVQA